MRAPCNKECKHRQSHADKHQFRIMDFPGGGGNHQFTEGVAALGNLRIQTSGHDSSGFPLDASIGGCKFRAVSKRRPLDLRATEIRLALLKKCIEALAAILRFETVDLQADFLVEFLFESAAIFA